MKNGALRRNGCAALAQRILEPAAAQPGDALGGTEQALGGSGSHQDQNPRSYQLDMALHERLLRRVLQVGRLAVSGRAPGDDIGEQRRLPGKPNG